jgi:hypothetical protein
MARQLTAADAKQSLTAHVTARGVEIFAKYGPPCTREVLQRLLADCAFVRYPCEIVFDAAPLLAGEFAHPVPKGESPEAGFTMYVHPDYAGDPADVAALVLYQLVAVNYGEFASAEDAESFGAAALGLTCDEYYAKVCTLAERVGGGESADAPARAEGCRGAWSCG